MTQPSTRFTLIDALRGIAAISVVLYHAYRMDLLPHARASLAEPFHTLLVNGYLGVYIFFVLSGFVIAYSVRDARITPGFIGRFALRRSLRLDPPYWVAIAAAVLVATLGARGGTPPAPSPGNVVAHMFYLQQFFGFRDLNVVFWTLSLEVQFYLVYVGLMLAAQRLPGWRSWLVFGPLWMVSLVAGARIIRVKYAVFLWAWPYFFLGVITAWHHEGRISSRAWALVTGVTCVLLLGSYTRWISADDAPGRTGVIAATALLLFLAGRARRGDRSLLQRLTLGRPLQYLGRVSYSLYLGHMLVAAAAARLGILWLGDRGLTPVEVVGLLVGCTLLSIAVAHLLHVAVERPAQRLSQRIALDRSAGARPLARDPLPANPEPAAGSAPPPANAPAGTAP